MAYLNHWLCLSALPNTYHDDTLSYSDNFEEHQQNVYLVVDTCTKVALYLKPEK
jgi:hypothetical protein